MEWRPGMGRGLSGGAGDGEGENGPKQGSTALAGKSHKEICSRGRFLRSNSPHQRLAVENNQIKFHLLVVESQNNNRNITFPIL